MSVVVFRGCLAALAAALCATTLAPASASALTPLQASLPPAPAHTPAPVQFLAPAPVQSSASAPGPAPAQLASQAPSPDPAKPQIDATWGIDRIDQRALPLNRTYATAAKGRGVTVYVMDSGITPHPDLGPRLLPGKGWSEDGGNTTTDCLGHGTHVAATIAGTTYGVAKQATVVPLRVFTCKGKDRDADVVSALEWVAANAKRPAVLNLSFGSRDVATPPARAAAIRAVVAAGITVVTSAGNAGIDACAMTPANIPDVITVAASTTRDTQAKFSNHGPCVDLFAPGDAVTSASYLGGAMTHSGTSMAAPHVAGAAALYLESHPLATPAEVAAALVREATPGSLTGVAKNTPNLLLYVGGFAAGTTR